MGLERGEGRLFNEAEFHIRQSYQRTKACINSWAPSLCVQELWMIKWEKIFFAFYLQIEAKEKQKQKKSVMETFLNKF